ncbi:flagellar biosynthetic protein FliO [Pengzhenrongella sp.]|uniref:FliO/MopB family protein n=1 Tax=Pengzhenrongella sp. TaxID=2888820 RepID=UPI002F953859
MVGLRVALALACVLGLIWYAGRRLSGTSVVGRRSRSVPITVIARQALGKGVGITLVEVAGRTLLLGVGDKSVALLTELHPSDADATAAERRVELDLAALDGLPELQELSVLDELQALDELDPQEPSDLDEPTGPTTDALLDELMAAAARPTAPRHLGHPDRGDRVGSRGALEGTVASPSTWRRAVDVVQQRTVRR